MNAIELLLELEKAGVRLWEENAELRYQAPKGALTDAHRAAIALHRAELLQTLRNSNAVAVPDPGAGAKLGVETARRVQPLLGCRLQQVFGMAEGLVCYTRSDDDNELVTTTQGRPTSPADEIRIVDDDDLPVPPGTTGHLLTRGPYTIRAYFNAPDHNARAFTRDGFYRTGDLARQLPSGHLVVEGRVKDVINRGGDKVSAEEIESLLLTRTDVLDVALVAMPDAFLGERSCAFVIARGTPPTLAGLRQFLREHGVAQYKLPDRLELRSSFVQTSVGKVNKKALREIIASKLAQEQEAA